MAEPAIPRKLDKVPGMSSLALLSLGATGLQAWRAQRAAVEGRSPPQMPPPPRRPLRWFNLRRHRHVKRDRRLAQRILLLGWSSADWRIIRPLVDAGLMPNLSRLMHHGTIGDLATLEPMRPPAQWTSLVTGALADRHGVLGFVRWDRQGERIRPVWGTDRRIKALWNILEQEGFRSHVIGWSTTHPAEPLHGIVVSSLLSQTELLAHQQANWQITAEAPAPWSMIPGTVHPAEFTDTVAALRVHPDEITSADLLPFVPRAAEMEMLGETPQAEERRRLDRLARTIAETTTVHAAATWALHHQPWDFAAVQYDIMDQLLRRFEIPHALDDASGPEAPDARYGHVITTGYRYLDMMLGRLLQLVGAETTVMVVSDGGVHPEVAHGEHEPALHDRPPGILAMCGPGLQHDHRIYGASPLDITPTVLTLFGLPVGQDMSGRVLSDAFTRPRDPDQLTSWEQVSGKSGMLAATAVPPVDEGLVMQRLIGQGYSVPHRPVREAMSGDANALDKAATSIVKEIEREGRYDLARVYLTTDRQELAASLLERLYYEAPGEISYALDLALCYLETEELDASRMVLKSVRGRVKGPCPALDLLEGRLRLAEGEPEQALSCFQTAAERLAYHPDLHRQIGAAYVRLKAWAQAEDAYRRALEIDPESPIAYHGLALALFHQNRYHDAAVAAMKSVDLSYHQPVVHYRLGEIMRQLGDHARAVEAYRVAVEQAPELRDAHERLTELDAA